MLSFCQNLRNKFSATEFVPARGYIIPTSSSSITTTLPSTCNSSSDSAYSTQEASLNLPQNTPSPHKSSFSQSLFSPENLRTCCAFAFLFTTVFFMTLSQIWSDHRWVSSGNRRPLDDLVFTYIPFTLEDYPAVPDVIVLSLLGVTITYFSFLTRSPFRGIMLRRLGWIMGFLYFYRAITLSVTTVPSPLKDCKVQPTSGLNTIVIALKMMAGSIRACTDNIYSGHTTVLFNCALWWYYYSRHRVCVIIVWITAFIGMAAIVISHMHYTVDVVLSVIITLGMHRMYLASVEWAVERWMLNYYEELILNDEEHGQEIVGLFKNLRIIPMGLKRRDFVDLIVWMDGLDLRWDSLSTIRKERGSIKKEMDRFSAC